MQPVVVQPVAQDNHIGVAPAPDDIFKNVRNRRTPAEDTWGVGGSVSYIPDHAEYIKGKGNFVYYRGWGEQPAPLFPSKTIAPVEAIYAVSSAKRYTVNTLRFITQIYKRKRLSRFCQLFNDMCDTMLMPYYLEDGYYCAVAKNVSAFVEQLLVEFRVEREVAKKTGEIFGTFFEFDNAYRYRIQDLSCETTKDELMRNLPSELKRLSKIQATRELVGNGGGAEVVRRFHAAAKILTILWYTPFRGKIKRAISVMDIESMRMDEADFYHMILYGDYNARGMSIEERMAVYMTYHGTDQSKWPPRILIKPNA